MIRLFVVLISLVAAAHVSATPDADLEVTVQAPSSLVRAGDSFSYTATIRNVGKNAATNVRLLNDPPENVEITSVSHSSGSCSTLGSGRGDAVSCTLGDMEPGAMVSLSFTSNLVHVEDMVGRVTPDSGTPQNVDMPARAPFPPDGGWAFEIATVSVDVVGADRNRSNNVARVKVDIEPRSGGLPLVRILYPAANGEIVRQAEITVRIQAYDTDGSLDRVVVKEHKYIPFPVIEDGVYNFMYMGKKYTAAQLTAYTKRNPPPVLLARQTGKDTFEYTITNPTLGPNQFYVEVIDKQGRSNFTSIIFIVK